MNDNQILVTSNSMYISRCVYNFMGIILEATGVFHFFAFMHSFQILVSEFGDFQTLLWLKSPS